MKSLFSPQLWYIVKQCHHGDKHGNLVAEPSQPPSHQACHTTSLELQSPNSCGFTIWRKKTWKSIKGACTSDLLKGGWKLAISWIPFHLHIQRSPSEIWYLYKIIHHPLYIGAAIVARMTHVWLAHGSCSQTRTLFGLALSRTRASDTIVRIKI